MINGERGNPRPVEAKTRCCLSEVVEGLNCLFLEEVGDNDIWVRYVGAGSMVRLGSLLFLFMFDAVIRSSILVPPSVTNQGKVAQHVHSIICSLGLLLSVGWLVPY